MTERQLGLPFLKEKKNFAIPIAYIMMFDLTNPQNPLVLVTQRNSPDPSGHPLYGFPGGAKNKKESDVRAAMREFREETGLQILDAELLVPMGIPLLLKNAKGQLFSARTFISFFNEACRRGAIPTNMEPNKHRGWTWVSIPDLISLCLNGGFHSGVLNDHWLTIVEETQELCRLHPEWLDGEKEIQTVEMPSYILED